MGVAAWPGFSEGRCAVLCIVKGADFSKLLWMCSSSFSFAKFGIQELETSLYRILEAYFDVLNS